MEGGAIVTAARWSAAGGRRFAVLVHGGAGALPASAHDGHRDGCRAAAERAARLLGAGGSALDAVQVAVESLEDDPRFNAGVGASLNEEGRVELDASIMEGSALRAGAVCVVRRFKNPVAIARAVLDDGRHVLLAADGAERFAGDKGFVAVPPESLVTDKARERLRAALTAGAGGAWAGGTVGAVALDAAGHCAAATSTGGTVAKRTGRVGDSPIVGAGNYADDAFGAVSATGDGEGILRVALAASTVRGLAPERLPDAVAAELLEAMRVRVSARGGLIVVDRRGALGWARTTETMSWAAAWDRGDVVDGV